MAGCWTVGLCVCAAFRSARPQVPLESRLASWSVDSDGGSCEIQSRLPFNSSILGVSIKQLRPFKRVGKQEKNRNTPEVEFIRTREALLHHRRTCPMMRQYRECFLLSVQTDMRRSSSSQPLPLQIIR